MGIDAPLAARPDVDNTAPALVSWVFRDLHDAVVDLMEGLVQYDQGESVTADALARLVRTPEGARWSQGWRLVANTGTVLAVAVEVNEDRPASIAVRVGPSVLLDEVPPWLGLGGNDDPAVRRQYLAQVIDGVAAMAERERRTDRDGARVRR